MVSSLRLAGAIVVGATFVVPLAAQKNAPATYAITNARIIPVSGPVIDKGTIVVRGGVIAAVGATVGAPADARLIDGSGLSIYPGLIDAYGTLGQVAAAAPVNGGGGRGAGGGAAAAAPARLSNYGAGLQPELSVVDELAPTESGFDAAHAAGITTALTGVGAGIFRGQSAVINLIGDDASVMIVKAGVSQNIGFARGGGGGRGGYPGSLMGVFAALRQELLDAQHYRDVKTAYDKNPRGMARPDFDPSLDALQPVINGTQPVIMFANSEREIIRALDLAREFKLRAMIAGGTEAYKVTARLKAENVPVLLSLNFPRRGVAGAAGGGGFGGGGGRGGGAASPDDPEPMTMLRARVQAPKTPNMLAAAGVKFAFESGADFTNMIANMRKAIAAGLPAEQALRAFTLAPAELFGVSDRLGTIEVGKIANLTITKGELSDSTGHVTQLFIDGRPVTVAEPTATAAGGAGGGRGNRPGVDATGRWTVSLLLDGLERTVRLTFQQDGDQLSGVIEGDLGANQVLNGSIGRDGTFYFTATVSLKNGTEEAEFSGTFDRDGIHGQFDVEGHKTGSFSGSHN